MANWSAQHYNALAKEIRELFPTTWDEHDKFEIPIIPGMRVKANLQRATLTALALNLAKRFAEDNERFDPLWFLDACSPNIELYPLSELWDDAK